MERATAGIPEISAVYTNIKNLSPLGKAGRILATFTPPAWGELHDPGDNPARSVRGR